MDLHPESATPLNNDRSCLSVHGRCRGSRRADARPEHLDRNAALAAERWPRSSSRPRRATGAPSEARHRSVVGDDVLAHDIAAGASVLMPWRTAPVRAYLLPWPLVMIR
jgi:hypothetical protein